MNTTTTTITTLFIGNINYTNSDSLQDIAGHAGYHGCVKRINECEAYLNIGTEADRASLDISDADIQQMIGMYVLEGFSVRVEME